ncbi:unnamed protein product [Moneuplotes crassus]|uniref:BZIP domain-containing protein n=1 Tax=Euplotes crassus TaxID=5936 RepID=A0AAD1XHA0_EUPCR|nr:unnamed protein product [Moneuplotes crassus]
MFFNRESFVEELDYNPFKEIYDATNPEIFTKDKSSLLAAASPLNLEHKDFMTSFAEKEESKDSHDSSKPSLSLKEKRLKARIRSKETRERKKGYIKELEKRIRELERENLRLQNLMSQTSDESCRKYSMDSKIFLSDFHEEVRGYWSKYIDLKTFDKKENASLMCENYQKYAPVILKKQQIFFDTVFKMLINNIIGYYTPAYYGDLTEEYDREYDVIKRLNHCTKYQLSEFKETNKINKLDTFVASLNPNKKQFNFCKNVYLKKEFHIKKKCQEAIDNLLKAKSIIEEANGELYLMKEVVLKSKILTDEQIINSNIKENVFRNDNSFENVWNLKIIPQKVKFKLSRDDIIGKLVKQCSNKEEYNKFIEFNKFVAKSGDTR